MSRTNASQWELPEVPLLPLIRLMHLTGENAIETARRCIVNEALAECHGCQKEAARILGISSRVMASLAADLRLRPKDQHE